jgi:hypothetical protein
LECLTEHRDATILPPAFWEEDADLKDQMRSALETVMQNVGFS